MCRDEIFLHFTALTLFLILSKGPTAIKKHNTRTPQPTQNHAGLTVVRLRQVALLVVRLAQVRVRQVRVRQVRDVRVRQRVGQPPGVAAASALRGRGGGGGGAQVGGA